MKNFWFKRISGQIKVKVIGIGVERLLNYLIKNNVVIWNVHRIDDKTVVFYMFIADLSHLRKAVHHHRVKVRFIKRAVFRFSL